MLGWMYECVFLKFWFEKISVKVKSEVFVIMKEILDEKGMVIVWFDNFMIIFWGCVNG